MNEFFLLIDYLGPIYCQPDKLSGFSSFSDFIDWLTYIVSAYPHY